MGSLDRLYSNLPVWAQHAAVSTYGLYWHWLRFGPGYGESLRGYLHRENFSPAQWKEWQASKLKELLSLALRHVPHYAGTWSPRERKAAESGDLSRLPLLEKDALRRAPRSFLRRDLRPLHFKKFLTSGSTGTPIETYWAVREIRDSLALREARSARWAGTSFSFPRATFSGRMVEPDPASPGPFHRFNLVERQVYLSPFHLRADTASKYVEALHRHKVQWLTGYAVSYSLLAEFVLEKGLHCPPLRAVITTSEKLTKEMREVMRNVFHCNVFEEYSTVENAVFVSECERGRLHVSPDACVLEILRKDASPCGPGEIGEVVATCLTRTFQPLIRYRVGDLAAWSKETCPCGRGMPVIQEVSGRTEDLVVAPDGRKMVRFHGIFTGQPHIRQGQIIQEHIGQIRVKVVPADGFCDRDRNEIISRVRQRLGCDVIVQVDAVAEIPRTKSGKFAAVVSLLNRPTREGIDD